MAGFLRKKTKKEAPPASSPLFARSSAPDDSQKFVVSGPMSLAAARKDSASARSVRQVAPSAQQQRRRSTNPQSPSSYVYEQPRGVGYSSDHGHPPGPEVKDARYSLPAQQPLAPVSQPTAGDPYMAYGRSFRVPQPARPDSDRLAVDVPSQQPRGPSAGTSNDGPSLTRPIDNQDRHSQLIDLPPEIALFQEFGDKLFTNTPPGSLNSKSTGQPQPQQQQHASSSSTPILPPSSQPPISHSPFIPTNIPPSPDNDMGINISVQQGNLSSIKASLRSSALPPNNFPPNNTPKQHHIRNEKHISSPQYPPNSPPRRAPTSPPAPTAHIPRSSAMPASPPKTPSKRQKALPQVPPEAQNPSMTATTSRHNKSPVRQAPTNPALGAQPQLVNNYISAGPNKPRIFAAQEAMNGYHQNPMNAKHNGHHSNNNRDSDAFRMSQLSEIPHEYEIRNGYPSPPSEHNRSSVQPQFLPTPSMSPRTSFTQQLQDSPQYNDSGLASGLSKPRSTSSSPLKTNRFSSTVPSPSTTTFNHSSLTTPSTSEQPLPPAPRLPFHHQHQNHYSRTASPGLSRPTSVSVAPTVTDFPQRTSDEQSVASLQGSTVQRPLPSPPSYNHHRQPSPRVHQETEFSSPVNSGYNTPQEFGGSEEDLKDNSHIQADEQDCAMGLHDDGSNMMTDRSADRNGRPLTPASPPKSRLSPAIELNGDVEKKNMSSKLLVDPEALQPFSARLGDQIQENGKGGKAEKKDKGKEEEIEKGERRREKGKGKKREKKKSSSLERTMETGGSTDGPLPGPMEVLEEEQGQAYPPTPRSTIANSNNRESRSLVYSQLISSPPSSLVLDIIEKAAEKEKLRVTDINGPYMLTDFVADPEFLQILLEYLNFYEWSLLAGVSRTIRVVMVQRNDVREEILERFLRPVGYQRWGWEESPEPLSLSLQDLSDYMRGVSTPTHEYARIADLHVQSLSIHPNNRDPNVLDTVRALTASARAYTRVVLRLRAQAEKEQAVFNANMRKNGATNSPPSTSRMSSRAPSPTYSSFSHSHSQNRTPEASLHPLSQQQPQQGITFRSPLYRMRRAPLLRVFVPSPEGDWLSDRSVLECEAECRRAGITHLLKTGDVIWDIAVGDEGNVGRLVWDGSYLIDLDYTYSPMGELPKYMHALAFPPSYFHRVIRSGAMGSNPIVHIDVSPWGDEIATNLQLLQDRVRTETPQGAYHNVVRWVHRSTFVIRPPNKHSSVKMPSVGNNNGKVSVGGKIPITGADNLFVDPGWYGSIVVEAEGTNEALADLQDRCGPGAFPPRVRGAHAPVTQAQVENRKVFRILRERSRPGEVWIKCVSVKERLL